MLSLDFYGSSYTMSLATSRRLFGIGDPEHNNRSKEVQDALIPQEWPPPYSTHALFRLLCRQEEKQEQGMSTLPRVGGRHT